MVKFMHRQIKDLPFFQFCKIDAAAMTTGYIKIIFFLILRQLKIVTALSIISYVFFIYFDIIVCMVHEVKIIFY